MAKSIGSGPDLQLPYLETFSIVAERGSFTAAAKALGMTQAAVSQRIHALEKMLGKPLFHRRGTRIQLTEPGQTLYEYAQRILRTHREAFDAITGGQTPVGGELSLAASSVPGHYLLPELLVTFREKYPHIHVRATIVDSLAAIREVENGTAHLGLVGRKFDSPHLEFRPFARDEIVLVVPADHAWKRRRFVPLSQVARQPLIVREPGSGSRWRFEQALADIGKRPSELNVALELGGNEAIKEAVVQGLGLAVLSTLAVARELDSGQLHALRVNGLNMERAIFLAIDSRRVLPPPARMFLQLVKTPSANS